MDEVELRRFRVVAEFEVDAEDAGHARGEVAGICEVATEDADDPPVTFSRVLQVIRVGANPRGKRRAMSGTPTDQASRAAIDDTYRCKAQETYAWYSDDLVIDQDAAVSVSVDGAFVSAWVWIPRAALGDRVVPLADPTTQRRR